MSSDKQKKAGYRLPDTIEGHPLTPICGYIPDDPRYHAAFRGAVWQLGKWWNWEKSYQAGDNRATRAAAVFRDALMTLRIGDDCERDCFEFPPNADFIEWFPHDPFTDPNPDPIPAGYNRAPWYISQIDDPVWGTQPGDVATDLLRFPPGSLPTVIPASGLPRYRINLKGTGTVEVHAPNMFGGSIMQFTIDDNPLSVWTVDARRDTVSAPPETDDDVIEEIEITEPGEHWIDVIIVSQLNEDIPFLHHGGGLRKVVLCGFDEMFDEFVQDWVAENLKFEFMEDCNLYFSVDAGDTFQAVPGWAEYALACFRGEPGADGEPGEPGEGLPVAPDLPTFSEPDTLCGAATYIADRVIALISDTIDDLATLTLQEVLEALLFQNGFESSVIFQLIGLLESSDTTTTKAELQAGRDDLICALYCSELDVAAAVAWAETYTGFGLVTKQAVNNALLSATEHTWGTWAFVGGATVTGDCTGCGCAPWCYEFLNGVSDYLTANEVVSCTATITTEEVTGCCGEPDDSYAFSIDLDLPTPATITEVEIDVEWHETRTSPQTWQRIFIDGVEELKIDTIGTGTATRVLTGEWSNVSQITIDCKAGNNEPGDGAYMNMTRLVVRGKGTNPFGTDNCEE